MDMQLAAEHILLVSGKTQMCEALRELLCQEGWVDPVIVHSGSEARRRIMETNFDAVIINTPLLDEFGQELAQHISENTVAGILLIVKNEVFDEVSFDVSSYGVMTISRPIHREVFYQAMHLTVATRERLKILERENHKLKMKLDETRLIDRAKYVLMESLQMTEAQAHKYIEKQSMDLRMPKSSVAENIIKSY